MEEAGYLDDFSLVNLGLNLSSIDCKSINKKNSNDWTLLMYACNCGSSEVVTQLLAKGASPRQGETGESVTPLMLAITSGDLSIVRQVFVKEEINLVDSRGWNALFYAVFYGKDDCVEYLISQGADPHARNFINQTALELAVASGMDGIVRSLLGNPNHTAAIPTETYTFAISKIPDNGANAKTPIKTTKMSNILKSKRIFTPNRGPIQNKENVTPEMTNAGNMRKTLTPVRAIMLPDATGLKQGLTSRTILTPQSKRYTEECAANITPSKYYLRSPSLIKHEIEPPRFMTVSQFLANLGLAKYSQIFEDEEVDFETFLTFQEENLNEIGISRYGPRRKIALAIQEFRSRHNFKFTSIKFDGIGAN